jgi:2-polyprenyl-3-methyl-5-hydroxy-6-metoxy-1,4-benzoquinol methylase
MGSTYGNKQKHESKNPIQQALLGRFKANAVRLARSVEPSTILEVGCGEGYMLEEMSRAGVGRDLLGVDISAPALAWVSALAWSDATPASSRPTDAPSIS